ncbi:glycosyltransferase family 4 protein [Anabaena cylindrica FACHB-243]|uniref:Glycosyl transferase group 1 n=1 Tax=Anabaena cylindrica (strain ATCC 27899 / PCC 7122) TaxID=272123 RepID=K9ZDI1_ANACC|nr:MULTISPECIES: glycosyltransferase family 4 protein [Anabaena]AFZ56435.1 glycosyl transferase group 1 [Anabaena cylindrica PCC 7122]MBD2418114.1 glycosyltransferase family 4 protein [Anabaena cylindrica FACHB-243]MBY5281960.1 glycosyltransferase family 4 protein [Anabaena sp. CCAP 1446/1C]MBY5311235.1 glycosyltransferase family 4 protein [Anabaena sp. CCAP 1446/1C]MCM2407392.1 glycosyltransferase family 4 protein [Anabaena sp. CCAP 1446/1C]
MKIAYVAVDDFLNKSSWTKHLQGRCAAEYYIAKNLTDESTYIDYISPLSKKFSLLTRAKWSLYNYIFHKKYYRWAEPIVVKNYAHQIEKKLKLLDTNIVLCPENIVPIAYLNCHQPLVLWTDATLSSLINFYRHMENLCDENIKNIYTMEAEALNRCQLIIYTSKWAAEDAMQTYDIPASKIKVVPYGANLECDRTWEDIRVIVGSREENKCKLLFMGIDWLRKGGNTAFQVAKELNEAGLKTELIVVGCQPEINEPLPEFVKVIGFVDKYKTEGTETINRLLAESHFLILPSRAEAFGHVFCEASSFGLPSLASNIGGIPTVVRDNFNGKTFSLNADISEYSDYIIRLMTNYSEYQQLAYSSFEQYQSRLNWQVSVQTAKQLMKELVD